MGALEQRTKSISNSIPFTTYVVKVVSKCNLNCSYCYMYNLEDKTYRNQPTIMSMEITGAMADRIVVHANEHKITNVHIILHGGEPLLMGKRKLRSWVELVRATLTSKGIQPYFSLQSNGVLVDNEWVEILHKLRISIGISIDGPKQYHDQFRVDHKRIGSYDDVLKGIRTLQEHEKGDDIFSCVMSVVNTDIAPKELFEFWQFLNVPAFDLSLPHANHIHKPPRGALPYGEWMIQFFDLWFDQNRPDRSVRYFENMLRMLFGYPFSTDNIGGKPVGVVVVETNGSIEPTDAFKCCEDGLTKLNLNVAFANFSDLYSLELVNTLQKGADQLCDTCQACDFRDSCGGGYMPHRFGENKSFQNPSVYCEDLYKLVGHMKKRTWNSLPREIQAQLIA